MPRTFSLSRRRAAAREMSGQAGGGEPGRSPLLFLGMLIAGAFLVLIGVSLAQEFRRQILLEQHVRALRTDIEARERRIADLRRLREYLETDAYIERAAREKLNYRKPGEEVVIVPSPPSPTPTPLPRARGADGPRPARAWFDLYFGVP